MLLLIGSCKNWMFFLMCFYTCARKKDGTYYKNSSMKFIEEPLLIVSFTHSSTANLDVTEFVKVSKTDGWEFNKIIILLTFVGYEVGHFDASKWKILRKRWANLSVSTLYPAFTEVCPTIASKYVRKYVKNVLLCFLSFDLFPLCLCGHLHSLSLFILSSLSLGDLVHDLTSVCIVNLSSVCRTSIRCCKNKNPLDISLWM